MDEGQSASSQPKQAKGLSTPPADVKRNRNQVTLPKFDGKGSLQSFCNQMDNAADLGNWDDSYKAGQAYAQLQGGALAYVDGRPRKDRATYDQLVKTLKFKYEGRVERQRARDRLRSMRLGTKESLDELATRIKGLVTKAFPPERQEEEALAAMKTALPQDLGLIIVIQKYRTIDECVAHLSEIEALDEAHSLANGRSLLGVLLLPRRAVGRRIHRPFRPSRTFSGEFREAFCDNPYFPGALILSQRVSLIQCLYL